MKRLYWAKLILLGILFISCASGGRDLSMVDDYYNLARDLQEQNFYSRSETYYLKCLSLDGTQKDCLFNLALLYLEIKQPDKAEPYLRKLYNEDEENTLILNSMGVLYSQKEEWETALKWFGKTLEQFPWDRVALYNSALVQEELSHSEESRKLWETLWVREKTYAVFKGLFPYYRESGFEEKKSLIFLTETEKEEERTELDLLLLDLYMNEALYEEALPLLTSLYESSPCQNSHYLFLKGDLLIRLYRIEEGLAAIRQAFREGYYNRTEIDELSGRLAPSTRDVLSRLVDLYFTF